MRNARFGTNQDRQQGYNTERGQRWSLETVLRIPVMELLCQRLHQQNGLSYSFAPYADGLIEEYTRKNPTSNVPDVIRGAPDFIIQVEDRIYYVELKIKTTRFRNTVRGNNGDIPSYGCESNYLDREPVYVNTLLHSEVNHLPLNRVWFLFALNSMASIRMAMPLVDDDWHFECINLDLLKQHVDAGDYTLYAGGYGKPAYLVRCDNMMAPNIAFP